jgi:hypothetical protein
MKVIKSLEAEFGAVLEQLDGYKLVQLCLEERVGQLTGEVAVHVGCCSGGCCSGVGTYEGCRFSFQGSQRLRTLGSCCVVGLREPAESSWRRS